MKTPNTKLTAECTIDIDEKRKIWVELSADGPEPEKIAGALASAVSSAALDVYARVGARRAEGGRDHAGSPRLSRKKVDLRGMGEIEDEPTESDPEAKKIVEEQT